MQLQLSYAIQVRGDNTGMIIGLHKDDSTDCVMTTGVTTVVRRTNWNDCGDVTTVGGGVTGVIRGSHWRDA